MREFTQVRTGASQLPYGMVLDGGSSLARMSQSDPVFNSPIMSHYILSKLHDIQLVSMESIIGLFEKINRPHCCNASNVSL